jgi:hypothetical protein
MRLLTSAVAGFMIASSAGTASAALVFFGEDFGKGEAGPPLVRGLETVNSDAAQASFLATLINPRVENFEGIAPNTAAPLQVSFNGISATLTGNGIVDREPNGSTNGNGRYGISGDPDGDGFDHYWESSSVFSIVFDNPVAAFGFYGIDIGDFDGQVTVTTSNGASVEYNIGNSIDILGGSVLFWGLIDVDNPFTSLQFGNTAAGVDFFAFDDFTIASPQQVIPPVGVPVPAPLALLAFGLGALAYRRRTAPKAA